MKKQKWYFPEIAAPYYVNRVFPEPNPSPKTLRIDLSTLKSKYGYVGNLSKYSVDIYRNKTTGTFIAGIQSSSDFEELFRMTCHKYDYPVGNNKHIVFVDYSNLRLNHRGKGLAKSIYEAIAQKYTLVSDDVHYKSSQSVWKELATSTTINVYLWDKTQGDFFRDNEGKAVRYNGLFPKDQEIWGSEKGHILMVATNFKY